MCCAPLLRLHADDLPAPGVQVADHVAHELLGGHHLDGHDRLEQHRSRAWSRPPDRHRAGDPERHLVRVHVVEAAVEAPPPRRPPSGSRRPARCCIASSTPSSIAACTNSFGTAPPTMLVLELRSPSPARWATRRSQMWPYCPRPPVCRMYLPSRLHRLGDGLAVGDLGLADVGLDLELAQAAGRR